MWSVEDVVSTTVEKTLEILLAVVLKWLTTSARLSVCKIN